MNEYVKKANLLAAAVEVEYLGRPRQMVSVNKIGQLPSIDLENYVPRDYYEKVVSEMAKRNVEAADIVRCSECKHWVGNISEDDGIYEDECKWITEEAPNADDFCSYGERRGGQR